MPFAACLEELLLPYALGLSETERAGLQIWHEGTGMLAELPTKSTMGGGLRAGELARADDPGVCARSPPRSTRATTSSTTLRLVRVPSASC